MGGIESRRQSLGQSQPIRGRAVAEYKLSVFHLAVRVGRRRIDSKRYDVADFRING